jgi:hypothetical protein
LATKRGTGRRWRLIFRGIPRRSSRTPSVPRMFSKAFFRARSQHHVGEYLVPENPAAARGIIGQRRSPSAVFAVTSAKEDVGMRK